MTLIAVNKLVDGKFPSDSIEADTNKKVQFTTQEDLEEFRQYLAINPQFMSLLQMTDSHTEFFKACELLSKVVDKKLQEDLFYAAKLGFTYTDIPSKLVYLLRVAIRKTPSPNTAIESIDKTQLARYLKPGVLPEGITVKQVMTNLIGSDFKLLVPARRKAKYKDFYEVYVENVDRVVLLPETIASQITSRSDLCDINYKENTGVCLCDTPLRSLCGYFGIVKDEFDLRGVK